MWGVTKVCEMCGNPFATNRFRPDSRTCGDLCSRRLTYWTNRPRYIQKDRRRRRVKRNEIRISRRERYHRNPAERIRKAAHDRVRYALETGVLKRPRRCSRCRKRCKPDAHHHQGYKPPHDLDIVWLCKYCHIREHFAGPLGRGGNRQ
jgi:hypothetical protein